MHLWLCFEKTLWPRGKMHDVDEQSMGALLGGRIIRREPNMAVCPLTGVEGVWEVLRTLAPPTLAHWDGTTEGGSIREA